MGGRRSAEQVRALGLWTAGWLGALLLLGLLWLGDLSLQWPALLVPVAWAVVAVVRGRVRTTSDSWDDWGD